MLTVVTGPPCSGKSTWVKQHARPGDIVIDFDVIAQALGSPSVHGHSPALTQVAAEARHAAIAEAITQHHKGARVFVVDTQPGEKRRWQYDHAGAKWVNLTATPDELHARCSRERPAAWHARIDQWLAADAAAAAGKRMPDPPSRPLTSW
jgi:hypothetical protein